MLAIGELSRKTLGSRLTYQQLIRPSRRNQMTSSHKKETLVVKRGLTIKTPERILMTLFGCLYYQF